MFPSFLSVIDEFAHNISRDIAKRFTYVDIDDGWFIFVLEKLCLKISTVNLP